MADGSVGAAAPADYNLLQLLSGYESAIYQSRLGRVLPHKQAKGKGKLVQLHLSEGRREIG